MKKYICFLLVSLLFFVSLSYGQNEPNYAPAGGGGLCSCTPPSNSSCTSDCLFSTCCVCWNPNTQTGGCGCYWGIATCRAENNSSSSVMNSSNFGELDPNAKMKFSFEKFNLLFNYFESKGINSSLMNNVFVNIKSKYVMTGQKISIENSDFAQILAEYSKLIDNLKIAEKEDLNNFIKSLK